MIRRIICLLLAVVFIIGLPPHAGLAADEFVTTTDRRSPDIVTLTAYNGPGGHVVIPNGVTSVSRDLFMGNTAITSVVVPNSVTFIDDGAFKGCSNLKTIALSANLTGISKGLFYECTALESITLGDKVTKIESSAFMNCDKLTKICCKRHGN